MKTVQTKLKPWGSEIWWAHTAHYAGKILNIKKGARLSLQYHEKKEESQYVMSGKVRVFTGTDKNNLQEHILNPGDKLDIPPKTIHRIEGLEESAIFEVSTPELEDVVKLADDYGRSGTGNNDALDTQLHRNL